MNTTIKKTLLHVLPWIPIALILYFFPLRENPDELATLYAFQEKGKEYLLLEEKFEETTENSSGRTSHSYSKEILLLELESKKIATRKHLNNVDLLKGRGPILWDFEYGDKGLFVFNVLDGKLLYSQNDLEKLFPAIKNGITKCSEYNNQWVLQYKDGSIEKFNDESILSLLNTAQYYIPLPDYSKHWGLAPSSGERSFLVYDGHKSAKDFLSPMYLYDHNSSTVLSTTDGQKSLVQTKQETGGDYYLGLSDRDGNFDWNKKSREFLSSNRSYSLVGLSNNRVLLVTKTLVVCIDLLTGNVLWKTGLRGDGIPFWWGLIGGIVWIVLYYYLIKRYTKLPLV